MKKIFLIAILLNFIAFTKAQERQISFFVETETYTIDKKTATKSNLFAEYEGFEEAKLFTKSENEFVLEISYLQSGQVLRERIDMNLTEKEELITQLLAKIRSSESNFLLDQSGRSALLLGTTAVGLSYYSTAAIQILDMTNTDSFKAPLATFMLTSGLSFLIPSMITKDKPVSRAQASMSFYGQTRGIYHGYALGYFLLGDELENRLIFTLGMGTSISEGVVLYKLAKKWNFERGDASMFQLGGDFGGAFGLLASDVLGFYSDIEIQNVIATSLITSGLGMYAGKKFADTKQYTLGDAIVVRSGLYLGVLSTLTAVSYFEDFDFQAYTVGAMIGMSWGTYWGLRQVKGFDFSIGQGIMTALAGTAGGLLGLGAGALLSTEENISGRFLLTTTTLGAFAGQQLMLRSIKKRNFSTALDNLNINFSLNPMAFVPENKSFMQYKQPLATLKIQF